MQTKILYWRRGECDFLYKGARLFMLPKFCWECVGERERNHARFMASTVYDSHVVYKIMNSD